MSPSTMKALVKASSGPGLQLETVPLPPVGPRDVLVKVDFAAICGSDVPIYDWDDPWTRATVKPGQIIGHEFSGTVVDQGEVVHDMVGRRVTAEGHLACGECPHCRRGQAHVCPKLRLLGFDAPGAFAEYVALPASQIITLPSAVPSEVGAILDPLGNAVHATLKAPLANASVLVTGCGPVGLLTIALAARFGARRIFAADPSAFRRRLAGEMGARDSLDPADGGYEAFIAAATRADGGVDVFFEMSGNPDALRQGFRLLRPAGQAVLLGLPKQGVTFDFANDLVAKGLTVHGVVGREMFGTWEHVLKLVVPSPGQKALEVSRIITHRVPIEDFDHAFALMRAGLCGKVVLIPAANS